MNITSQMIKELREVSGAGIMDCKKALTATNGDIELAVEWLNENGLMKAAAKNERIAAEGLCAVVEDATHAVIYEINSETDFVAKNDLFLALLDTVGNTLLAEKPADVEAALKVLVDGKSLEDTISQAVAVIGEKISLRRFAVIEKTADQSFGIYIHMGGRIAALALLENATPEVAKDIAMHIAALSPLATTREDFDATIVEEKRAEIVAGVAEEGKPEEIAARMVEGRMNKFFSESTLAEQEFVKNPDMKVSEYLAANNATVKEFVVFTVGEGIEKKEEDFAAEVMSQIR